MAKSRRKNGGPLRGLYKRKKLGKGWLADRKGTGGTRPVLRITPPENEGEAKAKS